MGFFSGMGRMVKPLVNFPKWMGAKQISTDAKYIATIAKELATPQKTKYEETFEEAMRRLRLTEADIQARHREFKRLAIIFFIIFISLISYLIYLIVDTSGTVSWRAIALTLVVSTIALVQFIRFHFWLYQIKQRKLGCSFKTYFVSGLLGIKVGKTS